MKNDYEAFVRTNLIVPKRLRIIRHLQADGTRMTIVDKIEAYSPGGHRHTDDHGVDC